MGIVMKLRKGIDMKLRLYHSHILMINESHSLLVHMIYLYLAYVCMQQEKAMIVHLTRAACFEWKM